MHEDGSAWFEVPARVPLYFQALDDQGRAVQTMRSWSTLQPGEHYSCVGCHEPKPAAPLLRRPQAMTVRAASAGAVAPRTAPAVARTAAAVLRPFYGPPRGFSFSREVQPIDHAGR